MESQKINRSFLLKLFIVIVIVAGIGIGIKYAIDNDYINFNPALELKYTDTDNTIKEGIYMTDVSDIVSDVMPSIVAITSKTLVSNGMFGPSYWKDGSYSEGAGSGIIINQTNKEILILTNNHVVEGANELSVQFIDEVSVDATVKGTSEDKDIAVISVKVSDLKEETLNNIKIATLGDSTKLKVGNGIIAIGNALGYGQSVTTGVVSALNREVTIDNITINMIQLDAAINGGNSGGALINSNGEVVGINSAKYSSSSTNVEGMGFAIPISDVSDLIEELMNGTTSVSNNSNITLGITGYMVNSNSVIGFYVTDVSSGSYASKNNITNGSIITAIDGNDVTSTSVITSVLNKKKIGDTVTLTVLVTNGSSYSEKEIKIDL